MSTPLDVFSSSANNLQPIESVYVFPVTRYYVTRRLGRRMEALASSCRLDEFAREASSELASLAITVS
uniref:Uncharacterized protein n=1 Tax=Vespula pensylvanica TaxID=30213 RepID=A0A834JSD9_VESPE|nr:hypothetical protein H0235_017098 [Vespula pensylvanica]